MIDAAKQKASDAAKKAGELVEGAKEPAQP